MPVPNKDYTIFYIACQYFFLIFSFFLQKSNHGLPKAARGSNEIILFYRIDRSDRCDKLRRGFKIENSRYI